MAGGRVFAGQGRGRHGNAGPFGLQVLLVNKFDMFEMFAQEGNNTFGEDRDTVLFPFPVVNCDALISQVEVLDAQAQGFHHAQPATIQELGDQLVFALHGANDLHDFIPWEDSWKPFGTGSADDIEGNRQFFLEDGAVKE